MVGALAHGYLLPGATAAEIAACEAQLGHALPEDYRAFLGVSNGFNDTVGQGYLVLWSVGELANAQDYAVLDPDCSGTLIGSNGGGTAYGIVEGAYIAIPFVFTGPAEQEIRRLGDSFVAFVAAIERGEGW